MSITRLALPEGYEPFLKELKERIRTAQVGAALAVNRELVLLYWSIGRDILTRQKQHGWGAKIIDRLAADLHKAFPEMTGLSPRNLKYMRAFAEAWPDEQIVQVPLAQITWSHNVLVHQIESDLYRRQGKALTNFTRTLPSPQSELAQQIVKDPYNFDFLTITEEAREQELERALIDHIRDFLLELGIGFAFVGSQYPIQVGGEEFRVDLLFYHLCLRCFVVLDLNSGRRAGPEQRTSACTEEPARPASPASRRARQLRRARSAENPNACVPV